MDKTKLLLDDNWQHRFFDLDALDTVAPEWQELVQLWDGRRKGNLMPPWSAFDMFDFRPWLGFITVSRVSLDPLDTKTVLWGTAMTEIYGEDRTGRVLSAEQADWSITQKDWGFLERIVTTPCLGLAEGSLYWKNKDFVQLSRLFFPFGEDGKTCDTMISATRRH